MSPTPRAAASCLAPDQSGADALPAVPTRDEQEVDVEFGLGNRGDIRLRGPGDHHRAEHHAVQILGDPHPGVRPAADHRLALRAARPRLRAPLLGISPRVHPRDGLIAKRQDRGDVAGTTWTDPHDPRSSKPNEAGYEQASAARR